MHRQIEWEGLQIVMGDDIPASALPTIVQDVYYEKISTLFDVCHEILPIAFVYAKTLPWAPLYKSAPDAVCPLIIKPPEDFSPQSRAEYADKIKCLAWVTDAEAALFLSEAWLVQRGSMESIEGLIPSEQPDREEVVMINYDCRTLPGPVTHRSPILRPEGMDPVLDDWEALPCDSHGGFFGNLLIRGLE